MRPIITSLALLTLITSSTFAALKATLPELKNEKQLAAWRTAKASELKTRTSTEESNRTGSFNFSYGGASLFGGLSVGPAGTSATGGALSLNFGTITYTLVE